MVADVENSAAEAPAGRRRVDPRDRVTRVGTVQCVRQRVKIRQAPRRDLQQRAPHAQQPDPDGEDDACHAHPADGGPERR